MKTIQERLRDGADTCHARNIQLDYARVATKAADRIDALEAEVAALTKDAGRYQWLRHGDNDEFVIKETPLGNPYLSRNELLDAQIDAAIAAQEEQV